MKQDELINVLHNTIDLNKKVIYDLTKDGTMELELKFRIGAGEVVTFEINTRKVASEKYNELEPFVFKIERDEVNGK